jgi:hypothetical protein
MATVRISGGVVHDLPADLRRALATDAEARAAWEDITPLARNEWICWTISVVKGRDAAAMLLARMPAPMMGTVQSSRFIVLASLPHRGLQVLEL